MPWSTDTITPRMRLIVDNDYCGDPDGIVQPTICSPRASRSDA